jgi:hypothetical protein
MTTHLTRELKSHLLAGSTAPYIERDGTKVFAKYDTISIDLPSGEITFLHQGIAIAYIVAAREPAPNDTITLTGLEGRQEITVTAV